MRRYSDLTILNAVMQNINPFLAHGKVSKSIAKKNAGGRETSGAGDYLSACRVRPPVTAYGWAPRSGCTSPLPKRAGGNAVGRPVALFFSVIRLSTGLATPPLAAR